MQYPGYNKLSVTKRPVPLRSDTLKKVAFGNNSFNVDASSTAIFSFPKLSAMPSPRIPSFVAASDPIPTTSISIQDHKIPLNILLFILNAVYATTPVSRKQDSSQEGNVLASGQAMPSKQPLQYKKQQPYISQPNTFIESI
jgi:hypothetical protein